MAQRKKGKAPIDIKENELYYLCEWNQCAVQFSDVKEFLEHVKRHMVDYQQQNLGNSDYFSCCWSECMTSVVGNFHDFCRHVLFHAFHVRIKCMGELLIRKSGHTQCSLDKQSRNWIPELPEKLQCGWVECGIVWDNPLIFYQHVASHCEEYSSGSNVQGGCHCGWADCDTVCKSKYKLKEHLRSHTQEKVISCPTCGGLFANRTKFFDHLTRQRESSVYCYQCSHCNKRFATERLLRDHMRHHVNHYKCPLCDMTQPSPSDLRMHIKYRHTSEKPFKCGHCSHSAKSANDLRIHLESHNQEQNFRCHVDKCRYKSKTYSSLANHFRKIHQNMDVSRYACHLCDKRFTRGHRLTRHLMSKHKFKWPPGHSKFRYKAHEDGFMRLQTVRYESIDVSEQMLDESGPAMEVDSPGTPSHADKNNEENQENDHPTVTMSSPEDDDSNQSQHSSANSLNALQPVTKIENSSISESETCDGVVVPALGTSAAMLSMPEISSDASYNYNSKAAQGVPQGEIVPKQELSLTVLKNSGDSEAKNARVDKNGFLVFLNHDPESNKTGKSSVRDQTLVYDGEAFVNLEMLGDVALQGQTCNHRS